MIAGPEYVAQEAKRAAALRLQHAVVLAQMHIKNPLFQRRFGTGGAAVAVRFSWPGILSVLDPETGEVLAVSEPGRPEVLRANFVPVSPSQIRSEPARHVR